MDWRDDAIVLSARKLGENSVRLSVLSHHYGRYAGLVRGAHGKSLRGTLVAGNEVRVGWSARLAEHLGQFRCELTGAHTADIFNEAGPLLALSSCCSLIEALLAEREPNATLYHGTLALLHALKSDMWLPSYIRWEIGLLEILGYGLDLTSCAATGQQHDLAFVSPKSGRSVSFESGYPYQDRLLVLPAFLVPKQAPLMRSDIPIESQFCDGLRLSGYFLHRDLFESKGIKQVAARDRLVSHVLKQNHV